jgi:hypothetical protein
MRESRIFLVVVENAERLSLISTTLHRKFPNSAVLTCRESEPALVIARGQRLDAIIANIRPTWMNYRLWKVCGRRVQLRSVDVDKRPEGEIAGCRPYAAVAAGRNDGRGVDRSASGQCVMAPVPPTVLLQPALASNLSALLETMGFRSD